MDQGRRAILEALGASALVGASTPAAKLLLTEIDPRALPGLVLLGAGVGLSAVGLVQRLLAGPDRASAPAPLSAGDIGRLALVILLGGMLGPAFLIAGVNRTSGISASLLLNLEAVLTGAIALVFLGERLGRRQLAAFGAIIAGSTVVSVDSAEDGGTATFVGCGLVVLACVSWALDTAVMRTLSLRREPIVIAQWKGVVGGGLVLAIGALGLGVPIGAPKAVAAALVLGLFSFGVSQVLFIRALRVVGVARAGALYATAPFAGALFSVVLLGERPSLMLLAGAGIMAVGAWLFASADDAPARLPRPGARPASPNAALKRSP